MFFLAILFLALLLVLLWLGRRAEIPWIKPAKIASGLLALLFATLYITSSQDKKRDGGEAFRRTYLERMRVQGEFAARRLAGDSTVQGVALLHRETEERAPEIREGIKRGLRGFGDKPYVEQVIRNARASSGDIDQLTVDALKAVVAAEPTVNTFIFSSMPNRTMAWRPSNGGKFVFLNATSERLNDWRKRKIVKFAVLDKPFDQQASGADGEMSRDLEAAFNGEFNLVEHRTRGRESRHPTTRPQRP